MLTQKRTSKYCVLLLTAALLAAALTGCVSTGAYAPPPAPSGNTVASPQQSPVILPSSDEPLPPPDQPVTDTQPDPSPSAAPVPTLPPEPALTPTPDPAPVIPPSPVVSANPVPEELVADTTPVEAELEDEAVALSAAPAAVPRKVSVVASGVMEKKNSNAVIDYSNTADGYVMVQYTSQTSQRLKVQVAGSSTTYTYNLPPQEWAAFPLSDGNGTYRVTVYQNVTGSKYATVLSLTTQVTLKDEFAPFLHSNQYVDYDNAPKTVTEAARLIGSVTEPLKQVEIVYDFVVKGMTYDKQLAAAVKSGYLPVLDSVLEKKSGICFDYAALMTGMLRSQGVPCKLVVGYAGTVYHAWISVWVDGSGWVDGVIWFDGSGWQRMDPTFASSGNSDQSILAYIGDGANYAAKYFY